MPREMMFRALKALSDPERFELLCCIANCNQLFLTNNQYEVFAQAGLVFQQGRLGPIEDMTYHITKFGQRLIDNVLKADDGE